MMLKTIDLFAGAGGLSLTEMIEYFFYSIYRGKLNVEIVEGDKVVEINKSNLGDMIAYYEEYCKEHMENDTTFSFTAPSYWAMLTNPNCKSIVGNSVYYCDGEDNRFYEC